MHRAKGLAETLLNQLRDILSDAIEAKEICSFLGTKSAFNSTYENIERLLFVKCLGTLLPSL